MKKQKESRFSIKPIVFLSLLALCIIISSAVKGHAAGKKTVRVTTQAELTEAINNSNVGTIVLRSETYDSITIASNKNAKTKKLIVDASYAVITNKAKFKSITISRVKLYKEAVSGNTIEIPTYFLDSFELAKKKSVKKLILTGFSGFEATDMYCVVRKGAKIKNIVFKDYDGVVAMDKSTRTLTFQSDAFEWGEPTVVTMKFDKAGRMIFRSEDYEDENEYDTEYTYEYDKNGNMIEAKGYVYYDGEKQEVEVRKNTYTSKNRLETSFVQGRYSALVFVTSYYYDSKGRVIRSASECSTIDGDKTSNEFDSIEEYTYDSKGRVSKMLSENAESSKTTVYEYNEKGYKLTEKETDSSNPGKYSLETNTYDKYGNNTKTVYEKYDGEITTSESTYDEMGEWIESVWTYPDGEQYVSGPNMAG